MNAASVPIPIQPPHQSDSNLVRSVNGRFVRPRPPQDDSPSTACDSGTVSTSTLGRVRLGTAPPPCFGQPPPSISQKTPPGHPPLGSNNQSTGSGGDDPNNPGGSAPSGGAGRGGNPTGGEVPPGGGPPSGNPSDGSSNRSSNPPPPQPPGRTPPQQSGGAGQPGGHPGAPANHQSAASSQCPVDPLSPLDRSKKTLAQFKLPSNYKSRSILDVQIGTISPLLQRLHGEEMQDTGRRPTSHIWSLARPTQSFVKL